MLPGTLPPTSDEWTKLHPNAMIRPSAKIGFTRYTSARCVDKPPVVYGSFAMTMSPSCHSGIAEITPWPGRPSDRLTPVDTGDPNVSPAGDRRHTPKSAVSLTNTVKPVRSTTLAISSEIA